MNFCKADISVGEVMDSLHVARRLGLAPDENMSSVQQEMMQFLETDCQQPDEGIWEVRGPGAAQVLLVDLLMHSWGTWDQVVDWLGKMPALAQIKLPRAAEGIKLRFGKWGKLDPLYILAVEQYPETNK